MPSITVTESFEDRGADLGTDGQRTWPRKFWVSTTDPLIGAPEVVAAVPVRRGDIYVSPYGTHDIGARASSLVARQRNESPYEWEVEVKYTSSPLVGGSQGGGASGGSGGPSSLPEQTEQENPLLRPPVIRWGGESVMEAVHKTRGGTPIMTTSRQLYDPPLERPRPRLSLHISVNAPKFNPLYIRQYQDHVNLTSWGGFEPNTAWCKSLSGTRKWENGIYYTEVAMDFLFEDLVVNNQQLGWVREVLNAGYYQLVGGNLKPIIDKSTGRPFSKPQMLKADGTWWDTFNPAADAPVYNYFNLMPTAEFNNLVVLPVDL